MIETDKIKKLKEGLYDLLKSVDFLSMAFLYGMEHNMEYPMRESRNTFNEILNIFNDTVKIIEINGGTISPSAIKAMEAADELFNKTLKHTEI